MASAILRPEDDVIAVEWTITDGGSTEAWQVLNDAVTQPTAPSTADDFVAKGVGDGEFECSVPTVSISAVSEAKLWIYRASAILAGNCVYRIKASGSMIAEATVSQNQAAAWQGITYTGNLTQAQVDSLTIEGDRGVTGTSGNHTCYAAYIELTYTPSTGGVMMVGIG